MEINNFKCFPCEQCPKEFLSSHDFKKHIKTNTRKKIQQISEIFRRNLLIELRKLYLDCQKNSSESGKNSLNNEKNLPV